MSTSVLFNCYKNLTGILVTTIIANQGTVPSTMEFSSLGENPDVQQQFNEAESNSAESNESSSTSTSDVSNVVTKHSAHVQVATPIRHNLDFSFAQLFRGVRTSLPEILKNCYKPSVYSLYRGLCSATLHGF